LLEEISQRLHQKMERVTLFSTRWSLV
jgi:hypothetical protein